MDVNTAYKNFLKGTAKFPKFKSKRDNYKRYKTNNQGGNIRIENNKIKLPKIGFVKLKYHRDFIGLIKSCTISKTPTDNYYVSVLVSEEDVPVLTSQKCNRNGLRLN